MRIYVDTSVFGGCFDPEFELWSTRLMHLFQIGKYTAVISDISEFEIRFAPGHIQQVLSEIPVANLEIVKLSAEAKELSEHYLKDCIMLLILNMVIKY
jgi:hypothetical protein